VFASGKALKHCDGVVIGEVELVIDKLLDDLKLGSVRGTYKGKFQIYNAGTPRPVPCCVCVAPLMQRSNIEAPEAHRAPVRRENFARPLACAARQGGCGVPACCARAPSNSRRLRTPVRGPAIADLAPLLAPAQKMVSFDPMPDK
jgi:hypothetical protein